MSTNDNQNFISDSCKEKYLKNDVVGVHHVCVTWTKIASSEGRKCGCSVTMAMKPNPHTTVVLGGSVNHGTVTSTDDNQNVISDGRKEKYLKMM